MSKIAVVMPAYNRAESTIKSIKSVVTDPLVSKMYIMDDGSDEENFSKLHKFCTKNKKINIIRNKKNMGFDYNFNESLKLLNKQKEEYLFVCESDMLLAKGWGEIVVKSFDLSPETMCITPMLHVDQLSTAHAKKFKQKCINLLGGAYASPPNDIVPIKINKQFLLRYVPSSICTMIFRNDFLEKIHFDQMNQHKKLQDLWLSWACFKYNNYSPKSLASVDPGLALSMNVQGTNPSSILRNQSWSGSFWWRYRWSSKLMRFLYSRFIFLPARLFKKVFLLLGVGSGL